MSSPSTSATLPEANNKIHLANFEAQKKVRALNIAFGEGAKWGIVGFVASGLGVLYGTKYSPSFNKSFGPSGKTAIPLMAGLFLWALKYELTTVDTVRRPEKYGLTEEHVQNKVITYMPFHHRVLNYVNDHPFVIVGSLGVPLAVTIFYQQSKHTHLTFSQKVMHSRVFAQGGIISIALITMGFKDYMSRNGRFEEPKE